MRTSDYTVFFQVSVTADSPEEAAQFALLDLRDETLGPWSVDVIDERTQKSAYYEVGEPEEND